VHDFLFQSQSQLTAANLKDTVARFVAANIAIDQEQYRLCVDNNLAMGLVRKDADLGQKLGVKGTPSIFINGVFYSGAKDASQLRSLVEEAMNGGGRSVPFLPVGTQGKGQPSGRNSCGGEPLAQSKR
jgi:protein-disulfide isomerase